VILGYALLTAEGGRHTAWRVYSAVPPDDVLVADIRLALAGQTRPAMYWQNGKVQIVTPAAQQTTSGAPAGAAVRLKSKLSADRVRAFIEAAYMLGHCKAAASGTRQRLEDMVRLENLRLEPADEPQREAVARVMADARATAAKAGAGSERECQENLGRNVQKVSALP